jgi:hypothetical protein
MNVSCGVGRACARRDSEDVPARTEDQAVAGQAGRWPSRPRVGEVGDAVPTHALRDLEQLSTRLRRWGSRAQRSPLCRDPVRVKDAAGRDEGPASLGSRIGLPLSHKQALGPVPRVPIFGGVSHRHSGARFRRSADLRRGGSRRSRPARDRSLRATRRRSGVSCARSLWGRRAVVLARAG